MEASVDVFVSSFKRSELAPIDEDAILSVFSFSFPDTRMLEAALDIIDRNLGAVSAYHGASTPDRVVWKVNITYYSNVINI